MGLKRLSAAFQPRPAQAHAPLDVRVMCFREVLHANNIALGYLTQIQQALADDERLMPARVRRLVAGVTTQTRRMVVSLNRMTGARFRGLERRFDKINDEIGEQVAVVSTSARIGYCAPLGDVDATFAERVGQKSAFLGEASRRLPGHVPPAFATSVDAYRAFMATDALAERVAAVLAGTATGGMSACFEASARATRLIESSRVPDEVAAAITEAVASIAGGRDGRLAVRSSALMEGGLEMSFAGQYRSLLNVPAAHVVEAFRSVIASKYSPEALAYRIGRGFADDEVGMCCCVMSMVEAVAAGVMYSGCRTPGSAVSLIQAVRGLGQSAVDGSVESDSYWFDCRTRSVVDRRAGLQPWQIVVSNTEGTVPERVAEPLRGKLILSDSQVHEIAKLARALEPVVGTPVDMEWAIDAAGEVFVLQVRPQPAWTGTLTAPSEEHVAGYRMLVSSGALASSGVAAGVVCRVESDQDIVDCPRGAVVVTRHASPHFAVLLPRVAAIVADTGEVTGHLATVARELRRPALFAARTATTALLPGMEVTVDASSGVVYEGRVQELLVRRGKEPTRRRDPQRDLLASVSDLIIPLTLPNGLVGGRPARACRTIHDIIRFCHQATVEAMFDLGDQALRRGEPLHRLVSDVPIDCRLFDLGGGVAGAEAGADVCLDQVVCRPMRALWQGMTDPRVQWNRARPVSLPGLVSAIINYNFDSKAGLRPMGEPSYVFVSADYLNLNSRLGFHFSTVDARVSEAADANYVSFRFHGGSTGIEQRSRRALLLQRILAGQGFETDRRADLLTARLRDRPPDVMDEALRLVGRLMGYVNHLDMALVSDEAALGYERAFLTGDYGYAGRDPGE